MKILLPFFLVVFSLLAFNYSYAQGWEKNYTHMEYGNYIHATSDSGYLVTGEDYPTRITKLNALGDTVWTRNIPKMVNAIMLATKDKNSLVVGRRFFGMNTEIYIEKLNDQGDTIWTKKLIEISSIAKSIVQVADSSYALFGEKSNILFILKIDKNGDTLFQKNYPFTNSNPVDIVSTIDSGFILLGKKYNSSSSTYFTEIIKTNAQGDTTWTKTYPYSSTSTIQNTQDGGFILAGQSNNDALLVKLNAQGNTTWTKTYGGSSAENINHVEQTTDGGYIFVGSTASFGPGSSNLYLVKTNAQGDTNWTKTYGNTHSSNGSFVKEIQDGYILSGSLSLGSSVSNMYVLKVNADGNLSANSSIFKVKKQLYSTAYPNPTTKQLTIDLEQQQQVNIQVSNLMGQVVQEASYQQQQQINLRLEGTPGVYFVHIQTDTGEQATFKVLKE